MRNHPTRILLSNGMEMRRSDYCVNWIEHVSVPWGKKCSCVMPREQNALITSILVVPWIPDVLTTEDDCGQISLIYNAKRRFSAPAIALANRYHGLTKAFGLEARLQLLGLRRSKEVDWWYTDLFASPLTDIIHVVSGIEWTIAHEDSYESDADEEPLIVEVGMLVKPPFRDEIEFNWKVE
jgi:hypothetical protein